MKFNTWSQNAEKVREEITLQLEMERKGYVEPNPERKNQLSKDLHHCEFMAKIEGKRKRK